MQIYNKKISDDIIHKVISDVKEKKELASFSDVSIKNYLTYILKRDKKKLELLSSDVILRHLNKKKDYKDLIKQIRNIARRIYGVYITKDYSKRYDYLKKEKFDGLLSLHLSTKERSEHYEEIYTTIKQITGTPKSVLDLACGLNPVSKKFISDKKILYIASDISEYDVEFLNTLLQDKIYAEGSYAFRCDLSDENELDTLDKIKTDWCMLLKALDPIEEINENITYKILDNIHSDWIIISFPTLTVSRKPMRNPRRNWFEKVLERKNLHFETFVLADELFYVVDNTKKQKT